LCESYIQEIVQKTGIPVLGKDYGVYFSILSAIATGHSQRSRIDNIIGKDTGGYLTMLDETYGIIRKHKPLFSSTNSNVRYRLNDNFIIFWFRFIYKYNHILEIGAFDALREIIQRDYDTFSGLCLEQYFKDKLAEEQQYTCIDSWWSRTGDDEIDIIAFNEINRKAVFYEVKRQAKELNMPLLEQRVHNFLVSTRSLKKYDISVLGLSMNDM